MTDVVLKLPIQPGEEALKFGRYLASFMEVRSREAEQLAASSDAPFMMIRADPAAGEEAKIVIFQHNEVADAFRKGWSQFQAALA